MDFLLNPNIAYLLLLGAVLLAMMSLVTPGTGFFEIGAFFCVVLGGYAIINLSFRWWALILLILSIIPFVYAIQKPKREMYLGLSIVLLILGSVFIFSGDNGEAQVHPVVALVASPSIAGFIWLAVRKSIEAIHRRPSHDLDALVDQIGEAKTKVHEGGSVQIAGELWSARSKNSIPAGSSVRVVAREGFILVVEKQKTHKTPK